MNEERKKQLVYSMSQHNNQQAFNELFTFYYSGLVSFVTGILKDRQLAEETVEDVFIKIWNNRNTLVSISNFSHYIYAASKYAAINALKGKKEAPVEVVGDDFYFTYNGPESGMISAENTKKILAAINLLPPRCRLIFRLIKEEGLKYEEVASLLNISLKTVEAQMTIALKKVLDTLKIMLPELKSYYNRKKA